MEDKKPPSGLSNDPASLRGKHTDFERIGKAFELAPYPVLICDTSATVVAANREATRAYPQLHRSNTQARWHEVSRVRDAKGRLLSPLEYPAARAIRGETIADAPYRIEVLETGIAYDVHIDAHPLTDDNGKIIGAISIHRVKK